MKTQSNIYRVLILEDDLTLEPIWEKIIEKSSPSLFYVWATNVAEAETLLKAAEEAGEPFDLIIADIFLSGSKTGLDFWHSYLEKYRNKMILTSGVKYDKMVKYLGNGALVPKFLQKPLNINECINMLTSAIGA